MANHLLQIDPRGVEDVLTYSLQEMIEVFTLDQFEALKRGEVIEHLWPVTDTVVRIVDMRIAARAAIKVVS